MSLNFSTRLETLPFKILKRNYFQAKILYPDNFQPGYVHGLIKIIFIQSFENKVILSFPFRKLLKGALHKNERKGGSSEIQGNNISSMGTYKGNGHGNYSMAGVKSDLSLDGLEVKSNHIVLCVSMVNVSDFYCCCRKSPQSYQLKTTPIYYPTVL